jgi:hypothetical protein
VISDFLSEQVMKDSILSCTVAVIFSCAPVGSAADNSATCATGSPHAGSIQFENPKWLPELSLGIKESYDDNVYAAGANRSSFPPLLTVPPPGSAIALRNHSSWVTAISPKVAVDAVPLLGDQTIFQTFSFGYAPEFAIYHDAPQESYDAHRFNTVIKAKAGDISGSVDNGFAYVHGNKTGPFYPGALYSAYANAVPRERREQFQDRSTIALRLEREKWFIRPTASLLYYDLKTVLTNVPGYINYADRYDLSGGLDLGYRLAPQLAATAGYRYGHQYQQKFSFSPYDSSSDYQRVLLGIEGKPWKWLELKIQGGPDFRSYQPDTADRLTPVDHANQITYYGEAFFAASITTRDVLSFKYKQFQWVSGTGKVPYFDSCYDLSYRRSFKKRIVLDLDAKLSTADYTVGNLATCQRIDWQYSASAGITYAVNPQVSMNLGGSAELGRNALESVANPRAREYDRHNVALSVSFKL